MGVGNTLKYLISVDPQGIVYSVRNLEKNASYAVNCQESSCTCKAFVKFGYCKHLLFVLKSNNRPSTTIDLSSVRTFLYRGNTRRAQRVIKRLFFVTHGRLLLTFFFFLLFHCPCPIGFIYFLLQCNRLRRYIGPLLRCPCVII
jgi:hypothetical protein